ncbi:MAG: hypothetical protein JSS72_04580 [Armatimonadetes bacterium]|nr:hypothetical protein [Armatimonadota bacterium]
MNWNDNPILEKSEDLLERGAFAELIAKALFAENISGATVVGLSGAWGSGKTSVANLVIKLVPGSDIVRFQPWMISTPDGLAREFFKELGKAVLPKGDDQESREARIQFYKYAAQALDALSMTSEALHTFDVPLTGLVSKGLKGTKKALEVAAKGLEAQSNLPTLREARDEIVKLLAKRSRQLLFVIDDIDRLTREEIRTLFQIVKACADFPNVRYLLLFDRTQVSSALDQSGIDGDAFLEKIVSRIFDLPEVTTGQLNTLIGNSLMRLDFGELDQAAENRLYQLEQNLLLPALKTVRQIKRYFGTAETLLNGVKEKGHLNVEPTDYLALEFIRQTAPKLYSYLRDEAGATPGGIFRLLTDKDKFNKDLQTQYEKAVEADEPASTLTREALNLMGYRIPFVTQNSIDQGSSRSDFQARRFNCDYWKRVYFGFDAARIPMPESEWREFVRQLQDPNLTVIWLNQLQDRTDPEGWILCVSSRAGELSNGELETLLVALMIWGDGQKMHGPLWEVGLDWTKVLMQIGESALSQFMFHDKESWNVQETVTSAIAKSGSVLAASILIGREYERWSRDKFGSWSGSKGIDDIAQSLRSGLRSFIEQGHIWEAPDPKPVVLAWAAFEGEQAYDGWWKTQVGNPSLIPQILNKWFGRDRGMSESYKWSYKLEAPLVVAVKSTDDSLLDENGQWAKKQVLASADST